MRRLLPILLLAAAPAAADPDSDGDGLPDFAERHKYGTDPARADSDGDGKPDGDPDERREYAYTVRLVVRVLRPAAAVTDGHQDARVLEEGPRHVTLEIVCYPFSRSPVEGPVGTAEEWLRPGPTSSWDEELRKTIAKGLESEGVRGPEATAAWLLRHARYDGSHFTTFVTEFEGGRPRLAAWAESDATIAEQWKRDLLAKQMFLARERGSCTSTAIYLAGCLRAARVPARLIYCIPPADGSDPAQVELLREGITHHRVRRTLLAAVAGIRGWTSHTMNEVLVGGRWHRLNYERLAPPPLDPRAFGLILPVLVLRDWADAEMAATVGRRQTLHERDELFPHVNPYVLLEASDRFGEHAGVANEPVEDLSGLTIVRALWYADRPPGTDMKGLDERSGHVLVQVREEGSTADYKPFYDLVDKEFLLRAEGRPDVPIRAERGYWGSGGPWGDGVFYLRIEPEALARMAEDVAYALVPRNGAADCRWAVEDGVTLARRDEFRTMTIDRIVWSDSPDLPGRMRESLADRLVLLAHVVEWDGFEKMKRFTASADPEFVLEAAGHAPVPLRAATGGITSSDGSTRFVVLMPVGGEPARGVAYTLRASNAKPPYAWRLALSVTR